MLPRSVGGETRPGVNAGKNAASFFDYRGTSAVFDRTSRQLNLARYFRSLSQIARACGGAPKHHAHCTFAEIPRGSCRSIVVRAGRVSQSRAGSQQA